MMTEHAFFLKDIVVEANKQTILSIEEMSIAAGLIHAVIGPSGAGKTTLLRVLNLLQAPKQGELSYFGKKLQPQEKLAVQRSMAMVFQKPAIFSGDVFYNVALGLKMRGIPRNEVRTRVFNALDKVGLKDLAKRQAVSLSGGEAQRMALARAMVLNPQVLLLDEPTANLDPANVALFEDIIKKVHVETGTTIIIVTHNLYQAKRVSHESMFLNKGRVLEKNLTSQLFTAPSTEETKLFISGEMIY